MPAKVAERDGKWRVIDPDGGILKNKKGTAVDGGGHASKKKAMNQAKAINASLHKRGKI